MAVGRMFVKDNFDIKAKINVSCWTRQALVLIVVFVTLCHRMCVYVMGCRVVSVVRDPINLVLCGTLLRFFSLYPCLCHYVSWGVVGCHVVSVMCDPINLVLCGTLLWLWTH